MASINSCGGRPRLRLALLASTAGLSLASPALAQEAGAKTDASEAVATQPRSLEDLSGLSISQLADLSVTSVAKRAQSLKDAPASVYVITHDEVMRSGAQTLPEILRLAPNLQVYQTSSSGYVITARGLNGNSAAQSYSNKLLVLIDGRTVYTPMFSGVYWDMQQVVPDDIERIEVISGPGATLWGANAVNGVINIITKRANQTQGALVDATVGNLQKTVTAQYGGSFGDNVQYRVYATNNWFDDARTTANRSADDHWSKPQTGFSLDWTPSGHDLVTFQGDIYKGQEAQAGAPENTLSGGNFTTRWIRDFDNGSVVQTQAFFDQIGRDSLSGGSFVQDTYDVEVQDSLAPIGPNQVVVGAGARAVRYDIHSNGSLLFYPASRTLQLGDIFAQDTIRLRSNLTLTAGLKVESDPYIGATPLPDVRLTWRPTTGVTLWSAISRAIRSPTPFDEDVVEKVANVVELVGADNFQPEEMTAYELGGRFRPMQRLSLSISTYFDDYDHLRSIEITPVTLFPLRWGNLIRGNVYGVEAWGDWDVASWWRLSASVNALRDELEFAPGSSRLLGVAQEGDDPPFQASLHSAISPRSDLTWDAWLRHVDALPSPFVPAYTELNTSIAWRVTDHVRLSISGYNLLHAYHLEYAGGAEIPRSVFGEVTTRF